MSNARKFSKIVTGTSINIVNLDSDLSNKITIVKNRLDSDDSAIQSVKTLVSNLPPGGLLDSDLKVVADLRNQLDSETLSLRNMTLDYTNFVYNATAGQTTFTGADSNSATLSYRVDEIQIFLNGIKLEAEDFTATDGTSVVLTQPAALNNQLIILVPSIKSTYAPGGPSTHDWSQTPTNTQAFQPTNIASNDSFGSDVAIDRNYAVIGSPFRDDAASNAGGAYVYYKSGGTWSQQQFIQGPATINTFLGEAAAIGGTTEGQRIAIGSSVGGSAGLVRWYERSGTTWSQAGSDTTGNSNSAFGAFIRMSGDTTLVGAYYDDTAAEDAGRVYVYTGAGNAQANFTSSDIASNDRFGSGIDIDGDLIVVGSPYKPEGGTRLGAAYIFERSGTSWTQKAKLTHSFDSPETNDRFGTSVACYEGDDGTNTIAVSTRDNDGRGAVYVFTGSGTSYSLQQKLVPSDVAQGDLFGSSSGKELQIDKRDGNALFIGSQNDDDSQSNSGSVYVFNRSGTTWSESYKLNAFTIGPSINAKFGNSLKVDEHGTLIVGANNEPTGLNGTGTAEGAVYIFDAQ